MPASPGAPEPVRLLDPARLSADDRVNWARLAESAGVANPFAQPWLVQLSLRYCDPHRQAVLAAVAEPGGRWIGIIPLKRSRSRIGAFPTWTGWSHPNQFTGTPLVRPDSAARFWADLLGWLDQRPGLSLALCNLPVSDPINTALAAYCQRTGRRFSCDCKAERAALFADRWQGPPAKLRRRIGGLERKLERENGPLSFEMTRDPARIAALAEPFLALEAAGWKGRAGSALAAHEETRRFFLAAVREAGRREAIEMAVLRSGGRIVAMSTQLVTGNKRHGFKASYDEHFAAYAPGLLLLARLSQTWGADSAAIVDSCARPGQEPVSKLWPDRIAICDCRIALGGPLRQFGFAALLRAEHAWHGVKQLLSTRAATDKA